MLKCWNQYVLYTTIQVILYNKYDMFPVTSLLKVIHSEPRTTGDKVQSNNLVGTSLLIHIFVLNWDDKHSW